MDVVKRIIADILYRNLGSYVDGLTKESIGNGIWEGNLELRDLTLKAESLAVLFESFGLDLPVTVTAGYLGLLRVEVPWTTLQSKPVRIILTDVAVVASPVSDGDNKDLSLRELRLKKARLATDESVRDVKFSLRNAPADSNNNNNNNNNNVHDAAAPDTDNGTTSTSQEEKPAHGGWRFGFGMNWWKKTVTRIVDNIQVEIKNVIIQYEDASSVRRRPYTCTLAIDELNASAADSKWSKVFNNELAPIVRKIAQLDGLVLNWEPGISENDLKAWINSDSERNRGHWSGYVRKSGRHAIEPMNGELRVSIVRPGALAEALSSIEPSKDWIKKRPRVEIDLQIPDIAVCLDDFNYHTLLSTVMYLSDIDRLAKPTTAKGRWQWAVERLLPRFMERRKASLLMREPPILLAKRNELRKKYIKSRNSVITSRRKNWRVRADDLAVVAQIEAEEPYEDILLFRDNADIQLCREADEQHSNKGWHFWSPFRRGKQHRQLGGSNEHEPRAQSEPGGSQSGSEDSIANEEQLDSAGNDNPYEYESDTSVKSARNGESKDGIFDTETNPAILAATSGPISDYSPDLSGRKKVGIDSIPRLRMGFMLERGAIKLSRGGFPEKAVPVANLEFGELRLGVTTAAATGFAIEAVLGTFQAWDMKKNSRFMYARTPRQQTELTHGLGEELRFWASCDIDNDNDYRDPVDGDDDYTFDVMSDDAQEDISSTSELRDFNTEEDSKTGDDKQHSVDLEVNSPQDPTADEKHSADMDEDDTEPQDTTTDKKLSVDIDKDALQDTATTDRSYPSDVMLALRAIRNKEGSESMPNLDTFANSSTSREYLSESDIISQADTSGTTSLKYIAALRICQEYMNESEEDDAEAQTRLAMDLAIGGMEVILDGPDCAFISAASFWTPREKMPSIMGFLSRSSAPRLAFLRMEVQKAFLEHKEPMRMNLHIRAPRFVVKPTGEEPTSVVLDLGTFAMETATGDPQMLSLEPSVNIDDNDDDELSALARVPSVNTDNGDGLSRSSSARKSHSARFCEVSYTDYRITCSDLGLFVISGNDDNNNPTTERLVEEFSLNLVVQVLHNALYVEALTMHLDDVDVAKVKLELFLSSLSTSISHKAFRQVLSVVKRWNASSPADESPQESGSVSVVYSEPHDYVQLPDMQLTGENQSEDPVSSLVSFQMHLQLEKLNLELRDASSRRIVTISTIGTVCKLKQRPGIIDLVYQVHSFTVMDGSRGATAPYQTLAYAGSKPDMGGGSTAAWSSADTEEGNDAFVTVSYSSNLTTHEQTIAVQVLSLHMVCVRETYLALADFFYLVEKRNERKKEPVRSQSLIAESPHSDASSNAVTADNNQTEYADPFNALGTTTVSVARKFHRQATIGMKMSKEAFANRGKLVVTAVLDGFGVVLVSGEGAIASFKVSDCKSQLTHAPGGGIEASGQFGRMDVKDLTAGYEIYSPTVQYNRGPVPDRNTGEHSEVDGWTLKIPESGGGDPWLTAHLRNLKVVYVQRFVMILKKYFDVLRENLRPVLEIKGGIAEILDEDVVEEDLSALTPRESRLRLRCTTENIDLILPRHSQCPHEALRLVVGHSSITNEDEPAPGYKFGVQIFAADVKGYVLYNNFGSNRDRAAVSKEPLRCIEPVSSISDLIPFTEDGEITAKLDLWRRQRVPATIINSEGIPVLKEGEAERKYDPTLWKPTIRVRVCAPKGLSANLCEAHYTILYFCLTENFLERADIEFTDIVRGLKTPVLAPKKPILPIMLSSHPIPPNYQVLFDVASVTTTIRHGGDPTDDSAKLIRTNLGRISGVFEYGVDYHISVELTGLLHSLIDVRPHALRQNATVISSATTKSHSASPGSAGGVVTLHWDRPHQRCVNIMVGVSDIRVIVVPELFRDLGLLTTPGFPYMDASARQPFLRFNGRQLILTVTRPEIWLLSHQHAGDGRSLVVRGDIVAKVQYAPVSGKRSAELSAHGLNMNLSNNAPVFYGNASNNSTSSTDDEIPLLYPSEISVKYSGPGYDPPATPGGEPKNVPGAELTVVAKALLVRVDVNDIPIILAIGSKLSRLRDNVLTKRTPQPGRFDEWKDKDEKAGGKVFAKLSLPHTRLIFTDEVAGYYIPIMELRVGNAVVLSRIWVTNAKFDFSIDLFNDEKGWWEPGIEPFAIECDVFRGIKSRSEAVQLRVEQTINANITPTTISGAFRVAKTVKQAIDDLAHREKTNSEGHLSVSSAGDSAVRRSMMDNLRPSVAAFCVRNETGRNISLWLPYDSTRKTLKASGGELEIAMPTEDLLWSSNSGGMDRNRDRQLSMQCTVSMAGYDPVHLSTAEVGSHVVYFFRESRLPSGSSDELQSSLQKALTLVWTVYMRNGVPVGCLRSLFRIVNETRTVFQVKVGPGLRTSKSTASPLQMTKWEGSDPPLRSGEDPVWIKAGESWSVPVHAVEKTISVRPVVLVAPDDSLFNANRRDSSSGRGRVVFKYHWSDPLSHFESLRDTGLKFADAIRGVGNSKSDLLASGELPSLSCRAGDHGNPFSILAVPRVGASAHLDMFQPQGEVVHWLDVVLRAPFLVSNALPRPVTVAIAATNNTKSAPDDQTSYFVNERIDCLKTEHIHTAGMDMSKLSVAIGYYNYPISRTGASNHNNNRKYGILQGVQKDLSVANGVPVGSSDDGNCKFLAKLDRVTTDVSQNLTLYSDFWIRNRSNSDLMFKNAKRRGELKMDSQEIFLRSRPPGSLADKYIAFSGPWIAFRHASDEAGYKSLDVNISEIERPVLFYLNKVPLIAEVRPARGEFHRSLIITVRNAVWIENRTDVTIQWCQPAALDSNGTAKLANIHSVTPGTCTPLYWDFEKESKEICIRRDENDYSGKWFWSRPIAVDGIQGDFTAKMYRPRWHEQYIARIAVTRLPGGVGAVVIHREDRSTPPYRIVNECKNRSIAFRQNGVQETSPWLVRPGKSTRYSWDNPQTQLRQRSLVVEVIETKRTIKGWGGGVSRSISTGHLDPIAPDGGIDSSEYGYEVLRGKGVKEIRHPNFNLNIDIVQDDVDFQYANRFKPPLIISVHVDGPTKVVTFKELRLEVDERPELAAAKSEGVSLKPEMPRNEAKEVKIDPVAVEIPTPKTLGLTLWIKSIGISFIDSTPMELAYLLVSGIQFRLSRSSGQQLVVCEVQDLQLDNQLPQATWPVAIWSPQIPTGRGPDTDRPNERKPFFEATIDGEYPPTKNGIGHFRGIFIALQEIQVNADEDFAYRSVDFVNSLLAVTGGSNSGVAENLLPKDGEESDMSTLISDYIEDSSLYDTETSKSGGMSQLYVINLELCPVKVTVSFIPSRYSSTSQRSHSFIRTLVAVLGNVENAEFRFNALELQHLFASVGYFRSLIAEFYIAQLSTQKFTLLTSNALMGNPSALFDSIAIGAEDFFYEPAKAKGADEFIESIGRGSQSFVSNTVGGIIGSVGEIPRAVAHGLETAVGDREYLAERESIRGGRARSVTTPAQGLMSGALSFGHGIASGAAGLVKDPVQGAFEEGASGFMKGLRKGVIGGVLKPTTGALDLFAETAAGLRNFMVSDRKGFAEPNRPFRTFLGANRDRLSLYDFNFSVGSTILQYINGADRGFDSERLVAWVDFTPIDLVRENESVDDFLWALIRKSTKNPNSGCGQKVDFRGETQRADKLRVGIITSKRVLVAFLNGNIFWEHPLADVVDTQPSIGDNYHLSIGVRPVGSNNHVVPPKWKEIHCGTCAARDAFNVALRKVLADFGLTRARQRAAVYGIAYDSLVTAPGNSFEMVDLSISDIDDEKEDQTEMKSLREDPDAEKRRNFEELNILSRAISSALPARSRFEQGLSNIQDIFAHRVGTLLRTPDEFVSKSPRSVRIILVNTMEWELRLIRSTMESGIWATEVPSTILPKSVAVIRAYEPVSMVKDVAGSFVYQITGERNMLIALRFVNTMLSPNSYAVDFPGTVSLTRFGGEKGDRVNMVVNLSKNDGNVIMPQVPKPKKLSASPDQLLFGRSEAPKEIQQFSPPSSATQDLNNTVNNPNADDPEIISSLASLGFSRREAHRALKLANGDISKAYASLTID